ncbi:MAG: hypothetical protein ACI8W8_002496 [Rhodothermales bacterium]|jgi:hypothetical protein
MPCQLAPSGRNRCELRSALHLLLGAMQYLTAPLCVSPAISCVMVEAMNSRAFHASFLLILLLALWMRLDGLTLRPMHGDEANQAYRLGELLETGVSTYDPRDFHGPALFQVAGPIMRACGVRNFAELSVAHLRGFTVAISMLGIAALWLLRGLLPSPALLLGALAIALSPAQVFYSRYFIHEPLLVTSSLLFIYFLWQGRGRRDAILAGLFLGVMHASKETFVFVLLSALIAAWITGRLRPRALVPMAATFLLTTGLLHSNFLRTPQGLVDAGRAYAYCVQRAFGSADFEAGLTEGAGHVKPPQYYAQILAWNYEVKPERIPRTLWRNSATRPLTEVLLLLLFVVGAIRARTPFLRFAAIHGAILFVIYSLIPYKTPWCVLGPWHIMLIVAGAGAWRIICGVRNRGLRIAVALLLGIGFADFARQNELHRDVLAANDRNPFVYSHSVDDVVGIGALVREISALHPAALGMPVWVVTTDYWPLPWYFRELRKVGYFEGEIPEGIEEVPLVIGANGQVDLEATHVPSLRGLRPGVHLGLWVRRDLWERYLALRTR